MSTYSLQLATQKLNSQLASHTRNSQLAKYLDSLMITKLILRVAEYMNAKIIIMTIIII